jgi:hypothetical protein
MPSKSCSPSESSPLLRCERIPQSYDSLEDGSTVPPSPTGDFAPQNKVSRSDLAWVLAGLWSAVFLGALDGTRVVSLRGKAYKPRRVQEQSLQHCWLPLGVISMSPIDRPISGRRTCSQYVVLLPSMVCALQCTVNWS